MELNEVLAFIAQASDQDARAIGDAAVERQRWHLRLKNLNIRASLMRGDRVFWKTEKHGYPRIIKGDIKQINTSTAKIKADDGQIWRVSLSLLEKEA